MQDPIPEDNLRFATKRERKAASVPTDPTYETTTTTRVISSLLYLYSTDFKPCHVQLSRAVACLDCLPCYTLPCLAQSVRTHEAINNPENPEVIRNSFPSILSYPS